MFEAIKKLFKKQPALSVPAFPLSEVKQEVEQIKDEALPKAHERKIHLGVIVGHTAIAGGAKTLGGISEYEYGKRVLDSVYLQLKDFPGLKISGIFRDDVGIRGAYTLARSLKCDAVIELHFNAHDGNSTGTLTLCTPDANDVEFSHIIHNNICTAFKRQGTSRGVAVIGKTTRGSGAVYAFSDGVNCLVEPFFGDNKIDAELGMKSIDAYAKAILQGTYNWGIKKDLIPVSKG